MPDDLLDARTQHFDRDGFAVPQRRPMHLGDRGGSDRLVVKFSEYFSGITAIGAFDDGQRLLAGKGWHAILQFCQFVGEVGRNHVPAGGEYLTELDEYRSQRFQRQTQTFGA